jgi:hypothetical protein
MKRYVCKIIFVLFISVLMSFPCAAQESPTVSQPCQYELRLNLNEYSVFSSAAVLGLNQYGGEISFDLKMTKEGENILWILRFQDEKLLDLMKQRVAEKAVDLLSAVSDFGNLDKNSQIALQTVASLYAKINDARNHPMADEKEVIPEKTK